MTAPVPSNRRCRDPRLVTVRRGGTLLDTDHRLLAEWAAYCAERVLHLFADENPDDPRPARAIEAARAWAAGEIPMTQARRAAVEAHAAARTTVGGAREAARSAGHAAAVAHMADHELGAAYYALRASLARAGNVDSERRAQLAALPGPIADLVRQDMVSRSATFSGLFTPGREG